MEEWVVAICQLPNIPLPSPLSPLPHTFPHAPVHPRPLLQTALLLL